MPDQIPVPNVAGSAQAAAGAALTNVGLVVGTTTTTSSPTVAAGNVISTNPAAGTLVNTGSAVDLEVSSGPAQVAVPNVAGSAQTAAGAALTNVGLVVGTTTTTSSPTVAAGNVISTNPAAGTPVNTGSAVDLEVSSRPAQHPWRQALIDNAPLGAFFLVALAFVAILASVFWPYVFASPKNLDKTLLAELANTEAARGLITFLVAVGTVGIALILIIYVATSTGTTEAVKERFAFSKEVLTSLIGILGTIIGFYFGATQDQTHGRGTSSQLTQLALQGLSIEPSTPVKGSTATLHATLSGGQPPYNYVIRFAPDTIKEIDGSSKDGTINQAIKLDAYDPTKSLDITLEGTDSTGAISGNRVHLPATP